MGGCFRLGENLGLCILILCMLRANCFHSFFVWMRFSVRFVYNCLWALCQGNKKYILILTSGFDFIYKINCNIYF